MSRTQQHMMKQLRWIALGGVLTYYTGVIRHLRELVESGEGMVEAWPWSRIAGLASSGLVGMTVVLFLYLLLVPRLSGRRVEFSPTEYRNDDTTKYVIPVLTACIFFGWNTVVISLYYFSSVGFFPSVLGGLVAVYWNYTDILTFKHIDALSVLHCPPLPPIGYRPYAINTGVSRGILNIPIGGVPSPGVVDMQAAQDSTISILSLDAGGAGVFSQLKILQEYMSRLAYDLDVEQAEILPCDHFDLITGVGTGGLVAIMLGCLRMTVHDVLEEFRVLGRTLFVPLGPSRPTRTVAYDGDKLRAGIDLILRNHDINPNLQMIDSQPPNSRARVMIGAVPRGNMSYIRAMRSYKCRETPFLCTLAEAACATMATQGLFEPVRIGQVPFTVEYIGAGTTFGNPADQILKEARTVFGNACKISVILSIGAGAQVALSQEAMAASIGPENVLSHIAFHCDATAKTLDVQLENIDGYLRLNVDRDTNRWTENDWNNPGGIWTDTSVFLERAQINASVEQSIELLRDGRATATVGQLSNYRIVTMFSAAKAVPSVSPFFVPRRDAWKKMESCLISDRTERRKIFVLHGMGGCGKTQLVAYFVQEHGSNYEQVLFVDANSKSTIRADLQAAIRAFGVEHRQKITEEGLSMLARDDRFKRWLIIYDNADDALVGLASYFPQSIAYGTIIVTTRNREHVALASEGYEWELGPMSEQEARDTLCKATRRVTPLSPREEAEASQLADHLGYLAVALVQAASYCFLMSSTDNGNPQIYTFGMYLKLLLPNRRALMNQAPSTSLDRYDRGVYATLDISYPKLVKGAQDLLRVSAFFHRSDIPLIVLAAAFEGNFADVQNYLERPSDHAVIVEEIRGILSRDGQWNEHYVNGFVQNLRSFSLVSTTIGDATVSLRFHRLVHAWARDSLDRRDASRFCRMTAVILSSCTGPQNTPLHHMVLPHVIELMEAHGQISTLAEIHVNDKAAFAILLLDSGKHVEAEILWKEVQQCIVKRSPQGREDDMAIEAGSHLALTYFKQGKWTLAETLQQEILNSRLVRLGETDIRTIQARACLAQTFARQANWQGAENEMEVVVEALQKIRESEHDVGSESSQSNNELSIDDALGMLVDIYVGQSKWSSALQKETDLLQLRKKKYGVEHWKTLGSASNIGKFRDKLGLSQ